MTRWLALIFLAIAAPVGALAQPQQPPSEHWVREGDRVTFTTARISLPTQVGGTRFVRSAVFSHGSDGIDTGLQYSTADRDVFATVYVYYPGLPHAGLSAVATEQAIRVRSGPGLRVLGTALAGAGGHEGAAIRTDYAGFNAGRNASSAAFIRAGRWIVKMRVSGPESRREEVERTMTALLSGIRFEGSVIPSAAEPLDVDDCPDETAPNAALLPSSMAETAEEAMIGLLAGAGTEGREQGATHRTAMPLIGTRWCLSQSPNPAVPILHARDSGGEIGHQSLLVAIISDSGKLAEVVRTPGGRHVLLLHDIGETRLLGAYDRVPSDAQITDIATGADQRGREARALVAHMADGNSDVTIYTQPEKPAASPTT